MSEVLEEVGITQINGIRKHLKKLHTVTEYARRYCKWQFYKPHPETQLLFHNSKAKERSIVLGTQQGKTLAASYEMVFQACNFYPEWYTGLKHTPPLLDRDVEFTGWFASNSSQQTRDGAQLRLFGDIGQKDSLGTGASPLDYIRGFTLSRGIPNFVDTVTLGRSTGGTAMLQSRSYEQQVIFWQSVPCDMVWMDEDPGYDDLLYDEAIGRTLATNGRIITSLTPLLGRTPLRKRFINGDGVHIFQVRGGIDKALHMTAERKAEIFRQIKNPQQQLSRIEGQEAMGDGRCFNRPFEEILHDIPNEDRARNEWWSVGWGLDFHHGGAKGVFVAVFGFYDPQTECLYINDIIREIGGTPANHLLRISTHKCSDAPAMYPHDGGRSANLESQDTLADLYRYHPERRPYGLRLQSSHVTFPGGGYNLDAGVMEMESRFQQGKLKIGRWLAAMVKDEYEAYHRDDKNNIVREDDHVLDAIRVLMMGVRFMLPLKELSARNRARQNYDPNRKARQHDPWNPQNPALDYD